jgi:membrane protease YdiL (CAAX protease family)
LGSLFVPGLGQYLNAAVGPGVAYTATAVAGAAVGATGDPDVLEDLPRGAGDQLAYEGLHLAFTAGALSSWDAWRRAIPALKREGKYGFLPERGESVGDLLTAPFDVRFAARWTTWVDLLYTGVVAGLLLQTREPGVAYERFRRHDAVFLSALSFNAAVGEEALFRGWIFPLLHQTTGERLWLSNGIHAGIFGALHSDQAEAFAFVIAGWAFYEGWLTRRNDWSIRESIFHHFWYDVIIGTATFLVDEGRSTLQVRLPLIAF